MPPRKSDASKVATGDEGTPAKEPVVREGINIEVHFPLRLIGFQDSVLYSRPDSDTWIVTRLAKGVLPPNTQIQGNAMLAMTKSATVFVNYLASQYAKSI
jgi:DNA polymerase epsilon subunit 3